MNGKKSKHIFLLTVKYILLAVFFLYTVFPFFWLLLTSLKGSREIYEFPVHYLPRKATLENYREVMQMGDFGKYICNSLFIALAGACLTVLIAGMSAYILSRMEFRSKPVIFMIYMMTQMLPSAVGFAPLYILMTRLGMVDRLFTVVLILTGGQIPFGTILLIGFMKGIPRALEESALLDGCGRMKTYFTIVMPLARAGLFSVFIFVFLACWNDVYTSVLYINSAAKKTLTVAIYSMIGKYDINWGSVAAGTLIAMAPAILLFGFMKEVFVENIAGAVKE